MQRITETDTEKSPQCNVCFGHFNNYGVCCLKMNNNERQLSLWVLELYFKSSARRYCQKVLLYVMKV